MPSMPKGLRLPHYDRRPTRGPPSADNAVHADLTDYTAATALRPGDPPPSAENAVNAVNADYTVATALYHRVCRSKALCMACRSGTRGKVFSGKPHPHLGNNFGISGQSLKSPCYFDQNSVFLALHCASITEKLSLKIAAGQIRHRTGR